MVESENEKVFCKLTVSNNISLQILALLRLFLQDYGRLLPHRLAP